VYVASAPVKKRDTTAGETVTLDSGGSPGSGGWDPP
jgi:hypothetical protein